MFFRLICEYNKYYKRKSKEQIDEQNKAINYVLKCMPYRSDFGERLSRIDKTKTIQERLEKVLNILEICEVQDKETRENILKFTETVIMMREPDVTRATEILKPSQDVLQSRLIFAKLINKFANRMENYYTLKPEEFLRELQPRILTQEEIEQLE